MGFYTFIGIQAVQASTNFIGVIPSRGGSWEHDFPFRLVGYVHSLKGIYIYIIIYVYI